MKSIDEPFTITYSNYFKIENKVFAFRKKALFDITATPIHFPIQNNSGSNGYWINRKWFSLSKISEMIIKEEKTVDISDLQWYHQIELDYVFNYETHTNKD